MKRIQLTQGKSAIVDDQDWSVVSQFKWYAYRGKCGSWYAKTNTRRGMGKRISFFLHQLLFGFKLVDHKDGDGLNNTRSNLRECSQHQNVWNRRKNTNSKSAYKGVTGTVRSGRTRFIAQIHRGKKNYYLGIFDDPKDAAMAYDEYATHLFGEFAMTNHKLGLL